MELEAINAGILSIVPPVVAIVLALVTKEVVFSLVLGILSGTTIYAFSTGTGIVGIFDTTTQLMATKLGDNTTMIIFLCLLGILVALVNRAGGSRAYGEWAVKKLKSKRSASVATAFLGILIFIDDYFNCLTVGTVMRPVTDRFDMSREKLAYLIDATAAPICIIAPISSWAASVMSYYPESASPQRNDRIPVIHPDEPVCHPDHLHGILHGDPQERGLRPDAQGGNGCNKRDS